MPQGCLDLLSTLVARAYLHEEHRKGFDWVVCVFVACGQEHECGCENEYGEGERKEDVDVVSNDNREYICTQKTKATEKKDW